MDKPPNASYRVAPVERGGTISGACRLAGRPEPVRLRSWPGMGVEGGQDDGSITTGEGQALEGCVVRLARVDQGKDWPVAMRSPEPATTIDIQPGHYEPRISLARPGSSLTLVSHLQAHTNTNVHVYANVFSRETVLNLAVDAGLTLKPAAPFMDRPGVYYVTEDMRRAFTAWIHVLANPYAELTSAQPSPGRPAGTFRLEDVPPGDYDLVCWHEPMDRQERLGSDGRFAGYALGAPIELHRRIHVTARETTVADFDVPAAVEDGK